MYLSVVTSIIGILFIFAGISGFIPGLMSNGLLFGYLYLDQLQSIVCIVIGVIALISALKYKRDRLFLQVFGVLFGLLAIASLVTGGDLTVTKTNMADTVVYIVITIIFLILGFYSSREGRV